MKKSILTTIFPYLLIFYSFGQNELPTIISKDTTITKANSPYIISSSSTISAGATMKIEAGVTIKFGNDAMLYVSGSLIVQGTENDSVYFISAVTGNQWGNIENNNSNDIEIYYTKTSGNLMFVFGYGGKNIVIRHCNIESTARGYGEDCIAVEGGKKVVVEYVTLKGAGGKIANGIKNDAIDLDDCDSCFIGHNYIYNFSDDAVDIGTHTRYAYIHDNILHNTNYGVTVGESSLAYVFNNISYHNDGGFQVHDTAIIYCENNTLYANTVGVECFHSEEGLVKQTGGTAIMKNTIFLQSADTDLYTQTSSRFDITYSSSDKNLLPGNNNFKADPMLIDPENGNFNLKNGSPCINAGIDTTGNKIDIGAIGLPVIPINPTTSIKNINKKDQVFVFPNPSDNFIRVILNQQNNNNCIAMLFDITGNEILKKEVDSNNNIIDIHFFPSGIYFVKITSNNYNFEVIKLVKK